MRSKSPCLGRSKPQLLGYIYGSAESGVKCQLGIESRKLCSLASEPLLSLAKATHYNRRNDTSPPMSPVYKHGPHLKSTPQITIVNTLGAPVCISKVLLRSIDQHPR